MRYEQWYIISDIFYKIFGFTLNINQLILQFERFKLLSPAIKKKMGNNKSSCMPICGDKDCELPSTRKHGKFKKADDSKRNLRTMLEEEAYERQEEIKQLSPIDNCFTYLEKQLINSNSEWATSLLFHYAGKMGELMDHKHKTYNWNIEVNLQDEVMRLEAMRECLSDSMKDEEVPDHSGNGDLDASSADEKEHMHQDGTHPMMVQPSQIEDPDDPFNYGAAPIGKDGSMVLMKNSNIFQFSSANLQHVATRPTNLVNASTNMMGTQQEYATSPDTYQTSATRNLFADNLMSNELSPSQNLTGSNQESPKKAHSQDIKYRNRTSDLSQVAQHNLRFQNYLEQKRQTDLFKRKVHIIRRHFSNSAHPLRLLSDLFANELENIQKKVVKVRTDDMNSSRGGDITRSQARNGSNNRTIIKLSDREQESDLLKQLKIKKFQQMQQIVKDFTMLLKHSIIRFYQIDYNGLRAFQKNYFSEKVKNLVLGYKVSSVLYLAAQDAYREDIIDFQNAMSFMQSSELEYYQVPAQFHLDEKYYLAEMKKKTEVPIKVLNHNLEKQSTSFRMQRLALNKSQINAPIEVQKQDERIINKKSQIRLSEKTERPLNFGNMMEFMKDMPPLEIPPTNPPDFMGQSYEGGTNKDEAAPGSNQSEKEPINKDKTETDSTLNNKKSRDSQKTQKIKPYQKSTKIIQSIEKAISFQKKKKVFIYAWKKLQKEVNDYWQDKETKIPPHKLTLCEDHRLCLMSYVIVQSQCADIYTSFLALNPFIDFNSMEEAVPLATIENSIQVIFKDYKDRQNTADAMSEGPIEQSNYNGRPGFDLVSLPRIAPSVMSDNLSFRSGHFANQLDGFKRQIEDIKLRQSRIFQQSLSGGGPGIINQAMVMSHVNGGIPITQFCDENEMNQEQEEEELHKRLCGDQYEYQDVIEDPNDKFETMKQKEIMKRWQNAAMYQRGTSFKNPRAPQGQGLVGERTTQLSFLSMIRRSQAPTRGDGQHFPQSSLFLEQPALRDNTSVISRGYNQNPIIKQNLRVSQIGGRGRIITNADSNRFFHDPVNEFKTPRLSGKQKRNGLF